MLTKTDLSQISKIVKSSEVRLAKKIDKIDKKLDKAIDFLDRDYIKLLKRIERIEKHLLISLTEIILNYSKESRELKNTFNFLQFRNKVVPDKVY